MKAMFVIDPNTGDVPLEADGNYGSRSSIYLSMWRMALHTTKHHLGSMNEFVCTKVCPIIEVLSR